jgi:hypothetical protein
MQVWGFDFFFHFTTGILVKNKTKDFYFLVVLKKKGIQKKAAIARG